MEKIDKDKAQTDPGSVFDKPADVVATNALSPAEKKKALQEWELDARLADVAAEEGMTKDDKAGADKGKKSPLPAIKKAQEALGVAPVKDAGPNKT